MSPRPRKASDAEVFTATARVMGRLGPAQLTLAEIASEAGLTAGALVQRFGSKRGLLLAFTSLAADGTAEMFAELRAAAETPLGAVRAYADCMARMGETPSELAHHLGWLQLDLTDPAMRRHLTAQARATRTALKELVREAVGQGELSAETNPTDLARALYVTVTGSLMSWAFFEEGTAADWVRDDVNRVLAPLLVRQPRRARAHRRLTTERRQR